jgi:hypothetical protein
MMETADPEDDFEEEENLDDLNDEEVFKLRVQHLEKRTEEKAKRKDEELEDGEEVEEEMEDDEMEEEEDVHAYKEREVKGFYSLLIPYHRALPITPSPFLYSSTSPSSLCSLLSPLSSPLCALSSPFSPLPIY